MNEPNVIGRDEFDDEDARSATRLVQDVTIPYEGGAVGSIKVSIFRSTASEDRGGVVIRITLEDQASSFLPTAVSIPHGIELHMAGDIESKTMVNALRTGLAALQL